MSSELDVACAEAMGQVRDGDCPLGDESCGGRYLPQIGRWPCLAPYSSDIEAARLLEDEIERQGRQIGYVMALMRMLNTRQMGGMDEKWALIHATPQQRARAFLEAMKTA